MNNTPPKTARKRPKIQVMFSAHAVERMQERFSDSNPMPLPFKAIRLLAQEAKHKGGDFRVSVGRAMFICCWMDHQIVLVRTVYPDKTQRNRTPTKKKYRSA